MTKRQRPRFLKKSSKFPRRVLFLPKYRINDRKRFTSSTKRILDRPNRSSIVRQTVTPRVTRHFISGNRAFLFRIISDLHALIRRSADP